MADIIGTDEGWDEVERRVTEPNPISPPENTDLVEEALTEHWGARCSEHQQGCPCCDAWAQYDHLVTRARGEV